MNDPIKSLHVEDMRGAIISRGREAVNIQFQDSASNLWELSMNLGNAMYLLSMLKGIQLTLDIPFPDDPRDPNAVAIRPSERKA
ncbi:hypothetical protein APY04_3514 [Hyphomicrobium sulfonivorans]|uniref:Uncharacterized protein n=1 Tax=Hyphomicrobium sulfonivorans TaxID=121290 RepID=A0A109B8V8_HYPSL|nr:hypothetical protein [Hyphomicrobium sulfonivorans]KWT64250.1 hypothetical protein APY04_3514 [Hyphomicrobium sulfonivorans]